MIDVMMMLGLEYQFSVDAAAFQTLSRSAEYRWPAQDRIGRPPARQFTGPGAESITLSGTVYPHYKGGLGQMDRLRAVAGKGEPLRLVDGTGADRGLWCVEKVDETRTAFTRRGAARRIDFSLTLARYGEER